MGDVINNQQNLFEQLNTATDIHQQSALIEQILKLHLQDSPIEISDLFAKIQNVTNVTKTTLEKTLKILKCKKHDPKDISFKVTTYPACTIEQTKEIIKKWLSIDDDTWLDVIFACALDRHIKGEPIWLFVIAVPSSTKTEILRAFVDGIFFYQLSGITPNSFVSGFIKPDGSKINDLAPILDGKVLILKDFTSVLSMQRETRNEIIAQLREFYDGTYSKKYGNMDSKLTYNSSFGLIAGVTPKIDQFYSVMGELGERFLKLRSNFSEDAMLEKCEVNEGKEIEMRQEITEAVMGFITNVAIKNITFTLAHIAELKNMAKYVARLRAPDYGRWEGDNFVTDICPQPEKPTRVYKQLKKLTKALCCIYDLDTPTEVILNKVWRVGKDSVPPDRQLLVSYLHSHGMCKEQDLIDRLKIPSTSLRRILYFLNRLDVLEMHDFNSKENTWWIREGFECGSESGGVTKSALKKLNLRKVIRDNTDEKNSIAGVGFSKLQELTKWTDNELESVLKELVDNGEITEIQRGSWREL